MLSAMIFNRRQMLSVSAAFSAGIILPKSLLWAADDNHVGPGPDVVIPKLMAGNKRFQEGHATARSTPRRREELTGSQYPDAAILSCSDSRVPPEIIFDSGLGELFVVRVAGNVVDTYGMASLEYAVAKLGVRTIVVLGHTNCGAVGASLDATAAAKLPGSLPKLTGYIHGGISTVKPGAKPVVQTKDDNLELAVEANADQQCEDLNESGLVGKTVKSRAAIYDLVTGAVTMLPKASA